MLAIEMDSVFAKSLHRLQSPDHRLEIVEADILKFPLIEQIKKRFEPGKKWKVVANLPYHITTPILTLLLPESKCIESLTVMVQKEFADRLCAKKATPEYSSFTLFLEFYATIDQSFTVSPKSFYPVPKVFSCVVHCKLHPPLLQAEGKFFRLTRGAFGKRRKMLRSCLKAIYPPEKVEQALAQLGHPVTQRAEQLDMQGFIALFEVLET